MSRCEDWPCCGHGDYCGGTYIPRNRGSYGRGSARRTPPKDGTTRANKYAGECEKCGTHLAAGAGVIRAEGGRWHVECRPAALVGPPTAVRMTGGCPGYADEWNADADRQRAEWSRTGDELDAAAQAVRAAFEGAEVTA